MTQAARSKLFRAILFSAFFAFAAPSAFAQHGGGGGSHGGGGHMSSGGGGHFGGGSHGGGGRAPSAPAAGATHSAPAAPRMAGGNLPSTTFAPPAAMKSSGVIAPHSSAEPTETPSAAPFAAGNITWQDPPKAAAPGIFSAHVSVPAASSRTPAPRVFAQSAPPTSASPALTVRPSPTVFRRPTGLPFAQITPTPPRPPLVFHGCFNSALFCGGGFRPINNGFLFFGNPCFNGFFFNCGFFFNSGFGFWNGWWGSPWGWGPSWWDSSYYYGGGGYLNSQPQDYSQSQAQGSTENGPFTWQNPNSGATEERPGAPGGPLTILVFKDGSTYAVTDYWIAGSTLHYVTSYGGENSISVDQLDFEHTAKVNADRGVPFNLHPERPQQSAPAPASPSSPTLQYPDSSAPAPPEPASPPRT